MAEILKEGNVELLDGKVAVLGYGSQGHAHALNLADSGVDVEVGFRQGSSSRAAAEEAGPEGQLGRRRSAWRPARRVPGARRRAALRSTSPRSRRTSLPARRSSSRTGSTSTTAGSRRRAGHDVIMVAPKGPGHIVRRLYEEGYGTPAVVAVAQDASGQGAGARPRLWCSARRRARRDGVDDVRRGDRDRPVRRADRSLRRRHAADPARFRDPGRGRLPAGGRVLRMPARAQAHHRPDLGGWNRADALLDLRHRRVRVARDRAEGGRRARAREHALGARERSATARSRRTGSPRWIAASRVLAEYRQKLAETQLEQVGARLRALNVREEAAEVHGR